MKTVSLASLLASLALIAPSQAALVSFNYSQTSSLAGTGSISAFSFDDGGGPINFVAMPMPPAVVFNPVPASTPAGFVGAQTVPTGNSNEANVAVGLLWSGSVTAVGTRGSSVYTMQIPLAYVPKQVQTPADTHDYNWSVLHGDSSAFDVSGASFRFAFYMSRDDVVDGAETGNTFQRYTQQTLTFAAGVQDNFTNTHTSSAPLKDATDAGDPQGTDAAGRPLAFYWGWRDGGTLPAGGAMLVDDFAVSGLLNANEATLTLIPEPSALLLAPGAALFVLRRRRLRG